eukprot:SAG11_NODE_26_length_23420_cov_40.459886_22_plen_205_part_00
MDDAYGWFDSEQTALQFVAEYNTLHETISTTHSVPREGGECLDVESWKGAGWRLSGRLDLRTFQKPGNAYLYIPSEHPVHVKKSFIVATAAKGGEGGARAGGCEGEEEASLGERRGRGTTATTPSAKMSSESELELAVGVGEGGGDGGDGEAPGEDLRAATVGATHRRSGGTGLRVACASATESVGWLSRDHLQIWYNRGTGYG